MTPTSPTVLARVRAALGRERTPATVPPPPAINEPITRLVHSDIGLAELFAARAKANKISVEPLRVETLPERVIAVLRSAKVRKVAMPHSALLDKLELAAGLHGAGFVTKRWPEMTLDEMYDFDCGLTDVFAAVAETGSLVIRPSVDHGRALSLLPPLHMAILEPRNFVPDLVDLFDREAAAGSPAGLTIISGPSKTADIELNLVTGVHGPAVVQVFILE